MTPESTTTRLASRLRSLREERGWTQVELCERAGIVQQSLSAYETGIRRPGLDAALALAAALDVSLDELAGAE